MGDPQPKLRATRLTRTFGRAPHQVDALGPLELTVAPGEFVCLVGPSGCGESTLLRIAAGLLRPTTGTLIRTSPPSDLRLRRTAHPPAACAGGPPRPFRHCGKVAIAPPRNSC
ncbi:ATP-binding cassette domain-containing protein [Streptomyces graminifolii]|uniref:ATP-binding cassette domain-containing protein n=1 Tax=Streptomyces graminifolii TaxID=1266771 RepID=UPI0040599A46